MTAHRLLVVAVVAAVLLSACDEDAGSEPVEGTDMNVTEATEDLQAFVTETLEVVAPGAPTEGPTDSRPAPCQSSQVGRDLDTERASYDLFVQVDPGEEPALLTRVAEHWESLGLELDRSREDDFVPEILAKRPGYTVSVTGRDGAGEISIGGTTDCLSRPDG